MRLLVLFACLIVLNSCKESGSSAVVQCLPDDATVSWSSRSNFKVNFEDPHSDIKALKPGQKRLLETVLNQVEKGELKAFTYLDKKLISASELKDIFSSRDTISVLDPDSGDYIDKIVETKLNRQAVTQVRVKEEWYYDETKRKMHSRVLGLAPLETIFNSDGSPRGDSPLFWVFFDEIPMD